MSTLFSGEQVHGIAARLRSANQAFSANYPGEGPRRQPIHTVYGGAHLFSADAAGKLGALALRALDLYAPDFVTFARAIDLPLSERLPDSLREIAALEALAARDPGALRTAFPAAWLAHAIYSRVVEKLRREPVEDFRIDFEDGYGNRPDAEEDGHAQRAAAEVARGMKEGTLPPYIGLRIKPFTEELRERSFRTLSIFLETLVSKGGGLPPGFLITLPKVTIPEQVAALRELLEIAEQRLGLREGSLQFEIMIEVTQAIVGARGEVAIPGLVKAAPGRLVAAHLGTYDYTASLSITAAHQHMLHPGCDFARHMMQVSLGGTGLWLSDGATNIMPVGPHRAEAGQPLSLVQQRENQESVHRAWRLHVKHVRHSLVSGFYQGWDLHPAQLPTRYAAVYHFFLEGLEPAAERLRNFVEKSTQATLVGDVFDDAATGQGLLNYFLRGMSCGAITEAEAQATGLTIDEIRGRSFVKIMEARRKGQPTGPVSSPQLPR